MSNTHAVDNRFVILLIALLVGGGVAGVSDPALALVCWGSVGAFLLFRKFQALQPEQIDRSIRQCGLEEFIDNMDYYPITQETRDELSIPEERAKALEEYDNLSPAERTIELVSMKLSCLHDFVSTHESIPPEYVRTSYRICLDAVNHYNQLTPLTRGSLFYTLQDIGRKLAHTNIEYGENTDVSALVYKHTTNNQLYELTGQHRPEYAFIINLLLKQAQYKPKLKYQIEALLKRKVEDFTALAPEMSNSIDSGISTAVHSVFKAVLE